MIAAGALTRAQFDGFSRFMIVTNAHYHGGVSSGTVLETYDTPFGKRQYTATVLDEEDAADLAAEGHDQALVAMHELGHQLLGLPDLYGDCAGRETVSSRPRSDAQATGRSWGASGRCSAPTHAYWPAGSTRRR